MSNEELISAIISMLERITDNHSLKIIYHFVKGKLG